MECSESLRFISNESNRAIQLRVDLMLNQLFRKHGLKPDIEECEIMNEAYILGQEYGYSKGTYTLLSGSTLQANYVAGAESVETLREELERSYGSATEWNALSHEEKHIQWDRFHDLCAQGIADDMYFYRVMMNMHMVDYVGH